VESWSGSTAARQCGPHGREILPSSSARCAPGTRAALWSPFIEQFFRSLISGALVLAEIEDREDVRMRERGHGPGLAPEARQRIRVLGEVAGQHLDRDVAAELRVFGAVDLAHPAAAQWRHDLVESESSPGRQAHGQGINDASARGDERRRHEPCGLCTAHVRVVGLVSHSVSSRFCRTGESSPREITTTP
jgi:hypothetical protein